jgi:hypothetical protein
MPVFFLQNPPPDTVNGLIIGYVLMVGLGLAYAVSLAWRQRSLKRDLEVLESLQQDDD